MVDERGKFRKLILKASMVGRAHHLFPRGDGLIEDVLFDLFLKR